jgi:hypothetical protein
MMLPVPIAERAALAPMRLADYEMSARILLFIFFEEALSVGINSTPPPPCCRPHVRCRALPHAAMMKHARQRSVVACYHAATMPPSSTIEDVFAAAALRPTMRPCAQ